MATGQPRFLIHFTAETYARLEEESKSWTLTTRLPCHRQGTRYLLLTTQQTRYNTVLSALKPLATIIEAMALREGCPSSRFETSPDSELTVGLGQDGEETVRLYRVQYSAGTEWLVERERRGRTTLVSRSTTPSDGLMTLFRLDIEGQEKVA